MNINKKKRLVQWLDNTASIFALVVFFYLSFVFAAPPLATMILTVILLLSCIYLSRRYLKKLVNLSSIYILFIVICISLSLVFSPILYDENAIFQSINIAFLGMVAMTFAIMNPRMLKYAFIAFFMGLAANCLLNLIFTLYAFGPFYGLIMPNNYIYVDGSSTYGYIGEFAYTFTRASVTLTPIELYMLYPSLLLLIVPFYFMLQEKPKWLLFMMIGFANLAVFSMIFVISKYTAVTFTISVISIAALTLLVIFKKKYDKVFLIVSLSLAGVVFLLFIFFILNSQYHFTGLRNFTSSNQFLNYLFNTNRLSNPCKLIFNNLFNKDKFAGFAFYFDEDYKQLVYTSNNIFANSYMYNGIYGFIVLFSLIFVFSFNYSAIPTNFSYEHKIDRKFFAIMMIYIFLLLNVNDVSKINAFNQTVITSYYYNPAFLMIIFVVIYSCTSAAVGETHGELK